MKDIVLDVSIWIIILPLLVGIINYKGLNKDSRWIFYLVVAGFVPQMLTEVIGRPTPLLNSSYNIYTPVELAILYVVFLDKYKKVISRVALRLSAFLYVLACGYLFLRYGIKKEFLNSLVCINNIIYMIWIMILLKEQFQAENVFIHKDNPFAWYLIAIIFYAPCTVLVFALYHYIRDQSNLIWLNLWIIQSVCNILLYLLFSAGLFLRKN